jgi:uncharacterized membrane protein
MRLAFLTGALASGISASALTLLVLWVVAVLSGSPLPWSIAPWLVAGAAAIVGVGTYLAEREVHRRTMARRRSVGEPWAFRD